MGKFIRIREIIERTHGLENIMQQKELLYFLTEDNQS